MELFNKIKITDDDYPLIAATILMGVKVNEFISFDDFTKMKAFDELVKKEPKYKELL